MTSRQDALREPRARAGQAVRDEIAGRGMALSAFARSIDLDAGTLGDFVNGVRWPQATTRARIESALGWPTGRIESLAAGDVTETVGNPVQDGAVLLDLPPEALEGLDEVEREEVIAAAKASALARAREIRRRLEDR